MLPTWTPLVVYGFTGFALLRIWDRRRANRHWACSRATIIGAGLWWTISAVGSLTDLNRPAAQRLWVADLNTMTYTGWTVFCVAGPAAAIILLLVGQLSVRHHRPATLRAYARLQATVIAASESVPGVETVATVPPQALAEIARRGVAILAVDAGDFTTPDQLAPTLIGYIRSGDVDAVNAAVADSRHHLIILDNDEAYPEQVMASFGLSLDATVFPPTVDALPPLPNTFLSPRLADDVAIAQLVIIAADVDTASAAYDSWIELAAELTEQWR